MRSLVIACLLLFTGAAAIAAPSTTTERVIASLSQNAVGITADFTGSQIFVFGAIERDRLADDRDDDLDVIIAITGPDERVVLRKKSRKLGIWVNDDSVEIDAAPSFYAVATSGPLDAILTETSDLRHKITIDKAIRLVGEASNVADPSEFSDAIIRLRRNAGIYFEQIGAVGFLYAQPEVREAAAPRPFRTRLETWRSEIAGRVLRLTPGHGAPVAAAGGTCTSARLGYDNGSGCPARPARRASRSPAPDAGTSARARHPGKAW